MAAGAIPVRQELLCPRSSPPANHAFGPGWKLPCQPSEIDDVEGGVVLPVEGVEVGTARMEVLVEVHPDRDPMEVADARHPRPRAAAPDLSPTLGAGEALEQDQDGFVGLAGGALEADLAGAIAGEVGVEVAAG